MRRSTEEVIREIKNFLDGSGGAYDWVVSQFEISALGGERTSGY
jgi:hypothetical protein